MSMGERVDRRIKVVEFRGDETTKYVILSHRRIDLAKRDRKVRLEYATALGTGRSWIPVSRRRMGTSECGWTLAASSSEAMRTSRRLRSSFLNDKDDKGYPKSTGWPEWFSHG